MSNRAQGESAPLGGSLSDGDVDTIIEVEDASVTFEMDRGTSKVLDGVDVGVQREEILGIVGESGSGKSMFASALLDAVVDPGILSGQITYHPRDQPPIDVLSLSEDELRKFRWEKVSMVFQGAMSSFNPTMKIRDHFVETLKTHDYDVSEGLDHARELLSDLYIEPDRALDSYPHELSGGMKQRALIALSLVLEPEVVVMDEPTAALDLLMQRSIIKLIEDIQENYDLTVVFITHDLSLVTGLADRMMIMYAFQFVERGTVEEIINEAGHPYTRALLNAVPNLDTPLEEMEPIEGSAPDPVNVPEGCSYHPRCPLADENCRVDEPALERRENDHEIACFYWEDTREEIPLALDETRDGATVEGYVRDYSGDNGVISMTDVDIHFEQEQSGFIDSLFSDPDTVHAVDDVTLDIFEHDVVALVGESGCGKTTLGKAAIGIQEPTDGSVEYRGQDIWETRRGNSDGEYSFEEVRRALQIIHQDPGNALNPNRMVKAILASPLKRWHPEMSLTDRTDEILDMLEQVGMTPPEDYANRYPHQLSGGEKQRVALVRALLMNPEMILADEAVSALDVSLRVEMMDLMHDLQDEFDTSYVFISHNLSNARYFAGKVGGRIGVMYLGELVEIGPAEQVVNDPQHPYTKVLNWSTPNLEVEAEAGEPPIREIDIPDPVDVPSGCRFHTRCPEAREVCRNETPDLTVGDDEGRHRTACFREYPDDHEYWESESITET